ncbi:hypothetical protein KMZ68_19440 [Bradyrhizobium sediminis]|uniref:Uncharacterized protein n=1 Tax=Bradyrhizobium sediminis TaxID=2840469 RepID=A0A975NL69_9BRAD|nr:hypothetical protein [Bradyrhizobium sediminis]QWG17137.1 hypothetical protein KMZ68_19440 [Bradyrhizobium sediminis]
MAVLAGWVVSEKRFIDGLPMLAASMLAASYVLAVLFLAPFASDRKVANEVPTFGVGMKFLLFGPLSLAAITSVGATIVNLKHRDFCRIVDCFSFYAVYRFHMPLLVSEFVAVSWKLFYIVFIAAVLVRLIQVIQKG